MIVRPLSVTFVVVPRWVGGKGTFVIYRNDKIAVDLTRSHEILNAVGGPVVFDTKAGAVHYAEVLALKYKEDLEAQEKFFKDNPPVEIPA